MDNYPTESLFDKLHNVFGKCMYKYRRCLRPGYNNIMSYRDRGRFYFEETDEEIIIQELSKLTFTELNSIDSHGQSILHLAVNYNRAGQKRNYVVGALSPQQNIVLWLLGNPLFLHSNARTRLHGYFCGTALHKAFHAKITVRDLVFGSENHGGDFDTVFVASEALDTMLDHKEFSKANINALNDHGLSPLEFAMEMANKRRAKCHYIRFSDNSRFCERVDCAVREYASDYANNIGKLIAHKELRLHGMFNTTLASIEGKKWIFPVQLAPTTNRCPTELRPSPGMGVLIDFCNYLSDDEDKNAEVCMEEYHVRIVNLILNKNSGQLNDKIKAQAMAICFGDSDRVEYCSKWNFNPREMTDKLVGAVVRKFFVKHADQALYAIEKYHKRISQAFRSYQLRDVKETLMEQYSITNLLWDKILLFAEYRNIIDDEVEMLLNQSAEINDKILPFFFGGVQESLERKFSVRIPRVIWDEIFEFVGLGIRLQRRDLDDAVGSFHDPDAEEEEWGEGEEEDSKGRNDNVEDQEEDDDSEGSAAKEDMREEKNAKEDSKVGDNEEDQEDEDHSEGGAVNSGEDSGDSRSDAHPEKKRRI